MTEFEAMRIWVDADACPVVIRDILCRAAQRTEVELVFVANQPLTLPPSRFIRMLQVSQGFDVADNEIARRVTAGDLVITGDIPLAAAVIERGGHALSPRGEKFTADTIRARLTLRDFMDTLRSSGVVTGGPAAMNQGDRQAFANHLDSLLARRPKKAGS